MAHGQPDFGLYAVKKTVHGLADNAELAARLGSIVTFDRRGDVLWLDGFESPVVKWIVTTDGAGGGAEVSPDAARNGGFSCKLTTDILTDDWVSLSHYLPYPVVSKIGIEVSFTMTTNLKSLLVAEWLYDGSDFHSAQVMYFSIDNKLQYLDNRGFFQDLVTDLDLYTAQTTFHTIKLVIDLETHKYVRVIFNETEYDMSALSYAHTPDPATIPNWRQQITITTGVDAAQSVYVDDVILTQNEP